MGISSARDGTEPGSNNPKRPENVDIHQMQAARRQVRQTANRDVPPSPHRLKKKSRQQRKHHVINSLTEWRKSSFDRGPDCAEGKDSVTRLKLLRCEGADEDVLNIRTAKNRERSSVASHR